MWRSSRKALGGHPSNLWSEGGGGDTERRTYLTVVHRDHGLRVRARAASAGVLQANLLAIPMPWHCGHSKTALLRIEEDSLRDLTTSRETLLVVDNARRTRREEDCGGAARVRQPGRERGSLTSHWGSPSRRCSQQSPISSLRYTSDATVTRRL